MALQKTAKATALSGLIGAAAIAAAFIMPFEGLSFKAYRDAGGVWTICRGHTRGVHEGMIATEDQCNAWYAQDVSAAEATYDSLVHTTMPANTKAAAISFIFNTGAGKFKSSTLLRKLNAGDRATACAQFLQWTNIPVTEGSAADLRDGVKDGEASCKIAANDCPGILTRRESEKELCLDQNNYDHYSLTANGFFVGIAAASLGAKAR